MRNRRLYLVASMALAAALAFSQTDVTAPKDDVEQSYERNFVRSSLNIKLDVLKEAAGYPNVDMTALYVRAIRFALDNASLLVNDTQLRDIAIFSVRQIDQQKYANAVTDLWNLFQTYRDPALRVPILNCFANLAAGNSQIVMNLNAFLSNQNTIRQAGIEPDYQTIDACVRTLGKLQSATSYQPVFAVYVSDYSPIITKDSLEALNSLKGDLKGFFVEVTRLNPPIDKMAALKAALASPKFSESDKAEMAFSALSVALDNQAAPESGVMRDLRYLAVRELSVRNWSQASSLAIRNYTLANQEYARKDGTKAALIDAINCVGAMGTSDAAQSLTLSLQLINAERDAGKPFDQEITLAIIDNLGSLGDKVAFDHLLFVSYLDYPEVVKNAAKAALKKLKL
jgi:hypothetical protein